MFARQWATPGASYESLVREFRRSAPCCPQARGAILAFLAAPNPARKAHDVDRVGEIVEEKGGARAHNDDGLAVMQCNYCQPDAYPP